MLAHESQIALAAVWRSDYDRCREIYGVKSDYSKRLRQHLLKAAREVSLTTLARNTLRVTTPVDGAAQGRS
jgi:hypothetical protein